MKDIVPELLEAIEQDFKKRYDASLKIQRIAKLIDTGKATYAEANDYAIEVGEILAAVFKDHISADILPDGRMYYNIAERILNPTLKNNHDLISTAAAQTQTALNRASKIGVKGIQAPLNQDRIDGLIEKLTEEPEFEKVAWVLDEPVINFSQSIIDDTAELNAEFQHKSGLRPTVTRKVVADCCDWCRELAGEYTYPDVPKDIYRRHRFCRCTIEYDPRDGRPKRNAITKKDLGSKEDMEARKALYLKELEDQRKESERRKKERIAKAQE